MKRRLVVLLDFLTIIKILWRRTEEYVYAQSWTEWFFLQENASSLSVVGCLCRVQWQMTDRPSSDMGEPGWSHVCARCAWYSWQPSAAITETQEWLFSSTSKASVTRKAKLTLPSGCDLGVLILVSRLLGCSHIPYCGRVNGFLKITVMIFASKEGTKLFFFFFVAMIEFSL